jgi:hypothetical protein
VRSLRVEGSHARPEGSHAERSLARVCEASLRARAKPRTRNDESHISAGSHGAEAPQCANSVCGGPQCDGSLCGSSQCAPAHWAGAYCEASHPAAGGCKLSHCGPSHPRRCEPSHCEGPPGAGNDRSGSSPWEWSQWARSLGGSPHWEPSQGRCEPSIQKDLWGLTLGPTAPKSCTLTTMLRGRFESYSGLVHESRCWAAKVRLCVRRFPPPPSGGRGRAGGPGATRRHEAPPCALASPDPPRAKVLLRGIPLRMPRLSPLPVRTGPLLGIPSASPPTVREFPPGPSLCGSSQSAQSHPSPCESAHCADPPPPARRFPPGARVPTTPKGRSAPRPAPLRSLIWDRKTRTVRANLRRMDPT